MSSPVTSSPSHAKVGSDRVRCRKLSELSIGCPFPRKLHGRAEVKLQLWPQGAYTETGLLIEPVDRPVVQSVAPSVVLAGHPNQILKVEGEHIAAAQPVLEGTYVAGLPTTARVLSPREMRVGEVPALSTSPGYLRKTELALRLLEDLPATQAEIFVVDQVQVRAISPRFLPQLTSSHEILARGSQRVYSAVPYTCFLLDPRGAILSSKAARIVAEDILKCELERTAGPGDYRLGVSASPDQAPSSYEPLRVLGPARLTRLEESESDPMQEEQVDLRLRGLWEWYAELPAPLVLIRDRHSAALLHVVSGTYRNEARTTQVDFVLPPTRASSVTVELSQTGLVPSSRGENFLDLRLAERPIIAYVVPNFIDSRDLRPHTITVTGSNFHKDGRLANLLCSVNGVLAPMTFLNFTTVQCLLQPSSAVQAYRIAISTNYGRQWSLGPSVYSIVLP
jgi:hypothetical protein